MALEKATRSPPQPDDSFTVGIRGCPESSRVPLLSLPLQRAEP